MRMLHRLASLTAAAGLALMVGVGARADLIPIYQSAVDNMDGTWTYHYNVDLTTDSTLKGVGDPDFSFATLLDVHHYVAGSAMITAEYTGYGLGAWHIHDQPTGYIGYLTAPPDDPLVTNVVLHYHGPLDYVAGVAGTIPVAEIEFLATGGPEILPSHVYTAQNHVTSIGSLHGNVGPYIGPMAPVPEPGVLSMLFGSGIGGSLLLLRRRARK